MENSHKRKLEGKKECKSSKKSKKEEEKKEEGEEGEEERQSQLAPNWLFYGTCSALTHAISCENWEEPTPNNEDTWWLMKEKNRVEKYCKMPHILQEMVYGLTKDVLELIKAGYTAYRGSSGSNFIGACKELVMKHFIKQACRIACSGLTGATSKEIPSLYPILGEDGSYYRTNILEPVYKGGKVMLTRLCLGDVVSDISPEGYSKWTTTKAGVFIKSAASLIFETIHQYVNCTVSCPLTASGPSSSSLISVTKNTAEEETKDNEKENEETSVIDTECPKYFDNESNNLEREEEEREDEISEDIKRTKRLIQRLEPLYDVVFVMGLDENGDPIDKEEDRPRVKGHAVYFAAVSSWFQNMLGSSMKESRKKIEDSKALSLDVGNSICVQPDIYLPEINKEIFECIQMWAYGGGSSAAIRLAKKDLPSLADAALSLELTKLHELCLDYMVKEYLSPYSVCQLLEYSYIRVHYREYSKQHQISLTKLFERSLDFAVQNFRDVCLFSALPEDNLLIMSANDCEDSDESEGDEIQEHSKNSPKSVGKEGKTTTSTTVSGSTTVTMFQQKSILIEYLPLEIVHVLLKKVTEVYDKTEQRLEPLILLFILKWCNVQHMGWTHFEELLQYIKFELFCPRFLLRHINTVSFEQECKCTDSAICKRMGKTPCYFYYNPERYTEDWVENMNNILEYKFFEALEAQFDVRKTETKQAAKRLKRFISKISVGKSHPFCECNTNHTGLMLYSIENEKYGDAEKIAEAGADLPLVAPCCFFYDLYKYLTKSNHILTKQNNDRKEGGPLHSYSYPYSTQLNVW